MMERPIAADVGSPLSRTNVPVSTRVRVVTRVLDPVLQCVLTRRVAFRHATRVKTRCNTIIHYDNTRHVQREWQLP